MAVYVRKNGVMVEKATGSPMLTDEDRAKPIAVPFVMSDIPEYRSPIDGRLIGSRTQRRDDLKRNGCVEYEPSISPTKGKIRNKAFAAKRGLKVSEEYL
ncbi:hypothetical protein [Rhizobium bangladeshense]|uniref:hypothetical protein n=1 Tax=Rhizobium bangladeshense TaxID=1138189 RepID=UPI001A9837AD|nr:hypothetical protein [Rhizobium bangladeshense]MBX4931290.1 hypothetical protein [Rhizobium bangladeshense]QSY90356.1 hypothetical protein J2J98_09655 [Rhizobium bangladeshense]